MKVCHISTLPPTQCGIADYTAMLMDGLSGTQSSTVEIVLGDGRDVGDGCRIRLDRRSDYDRAVDWINDSDVDVVSLQHEFGIYGGPYGAHVLLLVERINKPVVVTLHTTRVTLSREYVEILVALGRQSDALVTLTELSRRNVLSHVPEANVTLIRHGIPDVDFRYPTSMPLRQKLGGDFVFISAGHISPSKGIDRAVMALGKLREKRSDFRYLIVGKEHPQSAEALPYRNRVLQLIKELNLRDHVINVHEFLEQDDFLQYIMSADVGLALYDEPSQNSSGMVPTILGCGRPVIASPFEYVRATTTKVPGLYVAPSNDVDDICRTIEGLIERKDEVRKEMSSIYTATRPWTWDRIALQYQALFERVYINRTKTLVAKRLAMRSDRDKARREAEQMRAARDQALRDADLRALPRRALRRLRRIVKNRLPPLFTMSANQPAIPNVLLPLAAKSSLIKATPTVPPIAAQSPNDLPNQVRHIIETMSGWCTYDKAMELCGLIEKYDVELIVEVGVFGGRSLLPMAHALEYRGRGFIYGIEPWDNQLAIEPATSLQNDEWWCGTDLKSVKQQFIRYISEHNLAHRVKLLELSSDDAFAVLSLSRFLAHVDLIHIDGNHSEIQAKRDILNAEAILRPSGILVLDDIIWQGVAKVRDLITSRFDTLYEVRQGQMSYGVYQKYSI